MKALFEVPILKQQLVDSDSQLLTNRMSLGDLQVDPGSRLEVTWVAQSSAVCSHCGLEEATGFCSACLDAVYCSRECQAQALRAGHSRTCARPPRGLAPPSPVPDA